MTKPADINPGPFNPKQLAFLRGLMVNKPSRRPRIGLAGQLARDCGIGRVDALDPSFVIYAPADFKSAAAALHGKLTGNFQPARPQASIDSVEAAGCVAITPINMSGLDLPGARCATLSGRDAMALDFDVILLCGKFEMLLRLHQFGWLEKFIRGRRTLGLFEGGLGPYRQAPAKFLVQRSAAPVLAFYDLDSQGFERAAGTPRLEAVCLPDWQDWSGLVRDSASARA